MIIADHWKAGAKLKGILEAENEAPPPTMLAPKYQTMLNQLKAAEGKDFDILHVDMQAQAHMEAMALFRIYAGVGDDPVWRLISGT